MNHEPRMSSGNWQPWAAWPGDSGDGSGSSLLLLDSLEPPSRTRQSSRHGVTSLMVQPDQSITSITCYLLLSQASHYYGPCIKLITLVPFLIFSSFNINDINIQYIGINYLQTFPLMRQKHPLTTNHKRRGIIHETCLCLVYYIGHFTTADFLCIFYKESLFVHWFIIDLQTKHRSKVTTMIIL